MSRLTKTVVISLSLLVCSYVGLGYLLGQTSNERSYRSLTVYSEVLQRIQDDYVDEPNLTMVTAGALHGLLESLDPFSAYLSPREYADYKEKESSQANGEIGATLAKRFGYIIVVSVLPDSPAEQAGLRSGDILEGIAGFTTRDMSVGQANALLRGAPASSVKVSVVRRGTTEPQPAEITRAAISRPHVYVSRLEDVAYLRLPSLDTGVAAELRDRLQQLDRQGVRKLVLDLRDCARGPVSEGVAAAQLFLSSGTITVRNGQTVARQQFNAAPDRVVWRHPMQVAISDSTFGAAEVLASALGDNDRAELVGTSRTFGAASDQKLIPLDDGSAIVLTVAYYYTPSGKAIPESGVEPTVVVVAPDVIEEELEEGEGESVVAPPPVNREPSLDDPVLRRAIELFRMEVPSAA